MKRKHLYISCAALALSLIPATGQAQDVTADSLVNVAFGKIAREDLTTAAQLLEQSELFAGSVFMFDSFYGFTRQQLDLIEQITELVRMDKFDYIVIEASGVCEPEPIAQTICTIPTLGGRYTEKGVCRLDCIVTVVDALRMQDEFSGGDSLTRRDYGEEDIENLIISQIEFCNIILLNKASEVQPQELAAMKQILKTLQPGAEIIECDYADIDIERLLNTNLFDFLLLQ